MGDWDLKWGDAYVDYFRCSETGVIRIRRLREFSSPETLATMKIKGSFPTNAEIKKAEEMRVSFAVCRGGKGDALTRFDSGGQQVLGGNGEN